MIEEWYSVNIYFLVAFDTINLDVTLCSLLAVGVFHCPSSLSNSIFHSKEHCHKAANQVLGDIYC